MPDAKDIALLGWFRDAEAEQLKALGNPVGYTLAYTKVYITRALLKELNYKIPAHIENDDWPIAIKTFWQIQRDKSFKVRDHYLFVEMPMFPHEAPFTDKIPGLFNG